MRRFRVNLPVEPGVIRGEDETGISLTDDDARDLNQGSSITTLTTNGEEVAVLPGDWPSIFDLFEQVRRHPDFVFGTIFVREDFPGANVPEDFSGRLASDMLAERGSLLIEDLR